MAERSLDIPDNRLGPFLDGAIERWDEDASLWLVDTGSKDLLRVGMDGYRHAALAWNEAGQEAYALWGGALNIESDLAGFVLPRGVEILFILDIADEGRPIWSPKATFDAQADLLERSHRTLGHVYQYMSPGSEGRRVVTLRRDLTAREIEQHIPLGPIHDYIMLDTANEPPQIGDTKSWFINQSQSDFLPPHATVVINA